MTEDDIRHKLADFSEWLTTLVPHPEKWPWFGENEVRYLRFAEEAFRQGRHEVELKALIAAELHPPG